MQTPYRPGISIIIQQTLPILFHSTSTQRDGLRSTFAYCFLPFFFFVSIERKINNVWAIRSQKEIKTSSMNKYIYIFNKLLFIAHLPPTPNKCWLSRSLICFFLFSRVKKIIDVDECAVDNGGCEGTCVNRQGSYQCFCSSGFRLASNGKKCIGMYV